MNLVPAVEARTIWNERVQATASALGFTRQKTGGDRWVRDASPVAATFRFHITKFGFNEHSGGEFVVEFGVKDPGRRTSASNRMWRLLDDAAREEFFRINSEVIARLPGPSAVITQAMPPFHRETYVNSFRVPDSIPPSNSDVWCRYATKGDAERWGAFIATHLESIIVECDRRLRQLEDGTSSISDVVVGRRSE